MTDRIQGEGNRDADRKYREGLKDSMESKDLKKKARDAADALEDPEADELEKARRKTANH